MEHISQKEIDTFELPNRPMTIREMSIWNLINQRDIVKGKAAKAELRRSYVNQKNGVYIDTPLEK